MRFMKRFKCVPQGLAALALLGTATAAEPLISPTPSFRIPFAVEASHGVTEGKAILYRGRNGANMEVLQRTDANVGGFEFNAPSDGLYSFAVRMTDASGQLVGGNGAIEPELEVIVDTTAPELQFQLAETAPGEVSVSWKCNEDRVSPESLRLEYAEGSDGRWKAVETASSTVGQTVIRSQPGNAISIRGMITDRAGNRGGGSGQIKLASTAVDAPANGGPTGYPNNGISNQNTADVLAIPGAGQQSQSLGATPFYIAQPRQQTAATSPPAVAVAQPVVVSSQAASKGSLPIPKTPAPADSVAQPAHQQPISQQPAQRQQPQTPATDRPQKANYGHYAAASYSPPIASSQTTAGGQIVNNRVFDISYEVEDVGPSGVSTVKLFVTENNGQNWFSYGDDVDMRSPFQVDTRGEGTFGFAVRVQNGLGFSDPPPQPGELPSIVVTVDQTPPVANLAQPQIIADGRGHIRLGWDIADSHPSSTSVRLEYAISASGPWTPIFDWQADQGGHEMPIQPGMPSTIYYRLLARDAAGNVATAQSPHALMIDQHRPTVRLLSIQPVSARATRGF